MGDQVTFSDISYKEVRSQKIHNRTLNGIGNSGVSIADISPEQKKAYLCEVKKLAENVSCGDENYCQWITKNFGKTKGQDFRVHLFYKADKKDSAKAQKRPVFAVKVKYNNGSIFDKKINAEPDKKVSLPQVCEDAKDCVIPRVWTDDMDDCVPSKPYKLDFVPLSLDGKPIGADAAAAAAAAESDSDGDDDNEIAKLRGELGVLENRLTDLQQSIQQTNEKISSANEDEKAGLESEKAGLESEISGLQAKISGLQDIIETLKAKAKTKTPSKTPKASKEHEIFVEKATTTHKKLTFCVRDEAVGQVAFALQTLQLTQYFENGCIINCYQNEKNLNFCRNMGFKKLELGLYFDQGKYIEKNQQNPRLKRVCANLFKINLRFLPQFEYLDIGKNCRDAVRNLVMIPLIEKFYAENPHLVTSEVRRELGSQSCCYELARRTTGFFYTYHHNNNNWIEETEAEKILIGKQMVRFNGSATGNVLNFGGA